MRLAQQAAYQELSGEVIQFAGARSCGHALLHVADCCGKREKEVLVGNLSIPSIGNDTALLQSSLHVVLQIHHRRPLCRLGLGCNLFGHFGQCVFILYLSVRGCLLKAELRRTLVHVHKVSEALGQLGSSGAGFHAPAPVATQGRRHVDATLGAQAKKVLHLHHGNLGRTRPDTAHEAPVLLALDKTQVLTGVRHVRRVRILEPAHRGRVVVRAHVGDGVHGDVVRLVAAAAAVARVEGELEDLHAGVTGVLEQAVNGRCEEAQVLGDDGLLAQRAVDGAEQADARSLEPLATAGVLVAKRDGVVGVETAEVVDAQHVKQLELTAGALDCTRYTRGPGHESQLKSGLPKAGRWRRSHRAGSRPRPRDPGSRRAGTRWGSPTRRSCRVQRKWACRR